MRFNFKFCNNSIFNVSFVDSSKFVHWYQISVQNDVEELGVWICRIFSRDFLGHGLVECLDTVWDERISRSSRASPRSVASECFRHFLYENFTDYDLPF